MMNDEISDVRRIRHEISKRHDHDVKKLVAHYQELQERLIASGKYKSAASQLPSVASQVDETDK